MGFKSAGLDFIKIQMTTSGGCLVKRGGFVATILAFPSSVDFISQ